MSFPLKQIQAKCYNPILLYCCPLYVASMKFAQTLHYHLNKKELRKIHLCFYCQDALYIVFSGKHAEKESRLQYFIGGSINDRKEHGAGLGTWG